MIIFEKSIEEEKRIQKFLDIANQALLELKPYAEYVSIANLYQVRDDFIAKINDFYRRDRKLNIGVIGQVKAGKSTFLNTLLFNGDEILPSARTPKTAVLTKIEYADINMISVEYYNWEDWMVLEKYSKSDIIDNEHDVAREIMKMVAKNGVIPENYIEKEKDEIAFESSEELLGKINKYVGEDGKLTPMVKNVTIYMNRPELREISVVDTPGLNDAIISRTDKTREFIKKCDVVFFLSRASQFIDANDMKLLTSQLPQNGVEHLVLVCSRFDDGLLDELRKNTSLRDTIDKVKAALCTQASEIFKHIRLEENSVVKVLEKCENPYFVSSMLYNMAKKKHELFLKNEAFVYRRLNKYGDLTTEMMREIGNMDCIYKAFQEIVLVKDETLQQKAAQFLPKVYDEWKNTIGIMQEEVKRRHQILQEDDKEILVTRKKEMESQILGIKVSLETILNDMMLSLEEARTNSLHKLRDKCRECSQLQEKTGTEWFTDSRMVGEKHFLFFSWGGHKEKFSYSTTYTYLAVSDALENIRTFAYDACTDMENSLRRVVDVRETRRRLMQTVLNNFDSSDIDFDVNHFRHIVEMTLGQIQFPILEVDAGPFLDIISSKFSGQIRDSSGRSSLQVLLSKTMDQLFESVSQQLMCSVVEFKRSLNMMQNTFEDKLLKNIQDEFDTLQKQLENKEEEIKKYIEIEDKLKLLSAII